MSLSYVSLYSVKSWQYTVERVSLNAFCVLAITDFARFNTCKFFL